MTPEQRALRARLGGHAVHAKYDSRELTAPARAAMATKFEREVDPDNTLDPDERARRAAHAKKAHYTRLALASSIKRSANRSKR